MIFQQLSLKNKIFVSCVGFVLLISVIIGLFTRWLLISSLTRELHKRGYGIARSVADSSRIYILTKDRAALTALAFDTRVGNRKEVFRYLVITDEDGEVLAHTFTRVFPENLAEAGSLNHSEGPAIREMEVLGHPVFHLTVPVKEGLYTIGSVNIGLDKGHIQALISQLRFLFVSFLSVVTLIFFILSHRLAHLITLPVASLIRYTDQMSRGDYDIRPEEGPQGLYVDAAFHDELGRLTESFLRMTRQIRLSREELMASESKYRSFFAGGPNPIFVIDKENLKILDANPKAVELYGYTHDELVGLDFLSLGELDAGRFTGEFPEEGALLVSSKVRFNKRDGGSVFVNIHAGKTIYRERPALILATANITELVEKDDQLIQATKITSLEKMSVGIAHELNQPLNAIKMGSEYLIMMVERGLRIKDEDLTFVSREISTQVSRAAEIIGRLRSFSRKADFSRDLTNLNNCIRSVAKIVDRQLSLQNLEFTLDLAPDLPLILAHNNRMEQVIFNLITNARDAVNQRQERSWDQTRGAISVSTVTDGEMVIVLVRDNGVGIDAGGVDKIFESFYTTKEMGEGLGLGLTIVHGIVTDYNGSISVETEASKGTCFKLLFPAVGREGSGI